MHHSLQAGQSSRIRAPRAGKQGAFRGGGPGRARAVMARRWPRRPCWLAGLRAAAAGSRLAVNHRSVYQGSSLRTRPPPPPRRPPSPPRSQPRAPPAPAPAPPPRRSPPKLPRSQPPGERPPRRSPPKSRSLRSSPKERPRLKESRPPPRSERPPPRPPPPRSERPPRPPCMRRRSKKSLSSLQGRTGGVGPGGGGELERLAGSRPWGRGQPLARPCPRRRRARTRNSPSPGRPFAPPPAPQLPRAARARRPPHLRPPPRPRPTWYRSSSGSSWVGAVRLTPRLCSSSTRSISSLPTSMGTSKAAPAGTGGGEARGA